VSGSSSWARSALNTMKGWAPATSHPATGVLLGVMVIAGVYLRVQNIGYPFHHDFDESQYVASAQQFLIGNPDPECCHPPVGKLLIGVGMLLQGNNPVGWRFVPLVFGLQCLVIVFLLAAALFEDKRAAWLAMAFVAADGFFLSYSRSSLGDIILACLVLWSMLAAVTARGWCGVLASALLIGTVTSVKWVGLLIGLPACLAIVLLKRAPWYTIFGFGIVPVVHAAFWMLGFWISGQPNGLMAVINEMQRRATFHLGFQHFTNPLESAWYTWLVMYHPLVIKTDQVGDTVRMASSVGNPMLWFAADACLLALPLVGAFVALRPAWRARWLNCFDVATTKAFVILWVSWLSMLLLWMSGKISTYWYHYLYAWGFALVLLAGVVASLDRRYPRVTLGFVLLTAAVAVYFAPVWAELPISVEGAHRRLIFSLWQ
jgi:dolichyl-phosphate-mannose-protein mannosyltransferase